MRNIIYEAKLGDSVQNSIKESLYISRIEETKVQFYFNNQTIIVDYLKDTEESVYLRWQKENERKAVEYKKTDEYIERQKKMEEESVQFNNEMKSLLKNKPKKINRRFILWLKDFTEKANHVSVFFDKQEVLNYLESLGFKNSEYVGYKGEWTTEKLIKYTVGQIISCLHSFGSPHPITIQFCDDILKRKDFDTNNVNFVF